jgi:hypothetical protein
MARPPITPPTMAPVCEGCAISPCGATKGILGVDEVLVVSVLVRASITNCGSSCREMKVGEAKHLYIVFVGAPVHMKVPHAPKPDAWQHPVSVPALEQAPRLKASRSRQLL